MDKLIITVATTGHGTPLAKNPNLAITPKQIADEIVECYNAGASIAHIHVREEDGSRSMSFEKFKETVDRVRDRCDILINLTTSGMYSTQEERLKPLTLKPDLASFNAGSMNFGSGVFNNSFQFMELLAKTMDENSVKPEIEIYDVAMISNVKYLVKKGILKQPLHFQFVMGILGGMEASVKNLLFLKESIPDDATWGAIATGRENTMIASMSIHMNGHTRVGMEDNIYIRKGVLVKKNVEFVEKIKRLAYEFERSIATVSDAKKILKLTGDKNE